MSAPAAWHPDPHDASLFRYWDGEQWTAHTAPRSAPASVAVVSDKTSQPVEATFAWVVAVCTLGYMLPWAIAASRGKSNASSIGVVNLLLGWTAVGWIVALVMACGSHQAAGVLEPDSGYR